METKKIVLIVVAVAVAIATVVSAVQLSNSDNVPTTTTKGSTFDTTLVEDATATTASDVIPEIDTTQKSDVGIQATVKTTMTTQKASPTRPTTTKKATTTQKGQTTTTTKAKPMRVTLSRNSVQIKENESVKIIVDVDYGTEYGGLYYEIAGSNVYCEWGSWNGDSIPITITGKNTGTEKVYIRKDFGDEKILATINVTIKETPAKITVDKTSLNLKVGQTAKVKVTLEGNKTMICDHRGDFCADYNWSKEWKGDSTYIIVEGLSTGSCDIIVYFKDTPSKIEARVKVNVIGPTTTTTTRTTTTTTRTTTTTTTKASQYKILEKNIPSKIVDYSNYDGGVASIKSWSYKEFSSGGLEIKITGQILSTNDGERSSVDFLVRLHSNDSFYEEWSWLTGTSGATDTTTVFFPDLPPGTYRLEIVPKD